MEPCFEVEDAPYMTYGQVRRHGDDNCTVAAVSPVH